MTDTQRRYPLPSEVVSLDPTLSDGDRVRWAIAPLMQIVSDCESGRFPSEGPGPERFAYLQALELRQAGFENLDEIRARKGASDEPTIRQQAVLDHLAGKGQEWEAD